MRLFVYGLVKESREKTRTGTIYDLCMMVIIVISIVPLAFKHHTALFEGIDRIAALVFIIDYAFRLFTADYKLNRSISSFFIYPFTPLAIIDLISILPSVSAVSGGFRLFKIFRLFRTFRILRAFKLLRYSKSLVLIKNVLEKQKKPLITVGSLAVAYITIAALVIFNVEPESFDSFFEAFYWATISLTTVGYGDIYPVTTIGRVVTIFSSVLGVAIVALPAGIITAGYMTELNEIGNSH